MPQAKPKFDPSSIVKDELGWQLSKVMELNGCNPQCAIRVHDLNEHNVLIAHAMLTSKSQGQQRLWILEYFATHCPYSPDRPAVHLVSQSCVSIVVARSTCY